MSTKHTDAKNNGKKFFSGVAVLAISTFIVKIIGLLYKIPIMAHLGAEGMGYFNSAYEIYSLFFVIATAGIPVAISILISENKVKNATQNINKIFIASTCVLGGIGLIGTIILSVFHKQLAILIHNNAAEYCLLAISPTVLMICISSAIRGYFQGNQIMTPTAISQIIEALGKLILGLSFAIYAIKKGFSIAESAAFAVLGLTVGVGISLIYLIICKLLHKDNSQSFSAKTETTGTIIKKLFTIAIPITLSSTILSLTKLIDMTMILSRLNSIGYSQETANAIYGSYSTMAVSIFNLPATLVTAIALPLVPTLASAIEEKNKIGERETIASAFKMTALITFPAGLGIAVFSKPILQLIFSNQHKEIEYTAPLLSLLGLSVFISSMITVTNAILQSYKQLKTPIISMIIATLVKLAAAFILIGIPKINIYGAPISTFFSTLTIVAINLYFVHKYSNGFGSIKNLFIKPFIASIISITIGVAIYMLSVHFCPSKLILLITILIVLIVYLIFTFLLKAITEDDILMMPKGEKIIKKLKKYKII